MADSASASRESIQVVEDMYQTTGIKRFKEEESDFTSNPFCCDLWKVTIEGVGNFERAAPLPIDVADGMVGVFYSKHISLKITFTLTKAPSMGYPGYTSKQSKSVTNKLAQHRAGAHAAAAIYKKSGPQLLNRMCVRPHREIGQSIDNDSHKAQTCWFMGADDSRKRSELTSPRLAKYCTLAKAARWLRTFIHLTDLELGDT